MEEMGDQEKYAMLIFYNNVQVQVERMPGNPRIITSMRVYDRINNKSATVDLLEPVLEENHEGKRSICTRLVEMAGRTRQNSDYRLEKNAAVTVSERKSSYCMSQLSQSQDGEIKEDFLTRKPLSFKATFDGPSGLAGEENEAAHSTSLTASYSPPVEEKRGLDGSGDGKKENDEEEKENLVFASYNNSGRKAATKTSKKPQVRTKKRALYAGKKQA